MCKPIHFLATGILLSINMTLIVPLTQGQAFQTLHSFDYLDGIIPYGLVQGSDGNIYGTTLSGGENENGTVFKMTPKGALTTLISFLGAVSDDEDLVYPSAHLVQGGDGNFYGTTFGNYPFAGQFGTVFKLTPGGALTTLVSFNGTNGASPAAQLLQGLDGNFYGTTFQGGASGYGTLFRMTLDGTLTVMFSFQDNDREPTGQLAQGRDGNFYGTTGSDAPNTHGFVFRITPGGALSRLASIDLSHGGRPWSGVVEASDGNFYGTAVNISDDGDPRMGGVFKMTPAGGVTKLASFTGSNGSGPTGLVQGRDGNFYGTTYQGGAHGFGTVFKMTPDGALTTLISFDGPKGRNPRAGLVAGNDGNFYGTTCQGGANGYGPNFGANGYGTVFRIVMPVLNLRQSGNQLILSWPTNVGEFTLQSTPNLTSPVIWTDSTISPAVSGVQFSVTNAVSGTIQFYRLKHF